MSADEAEERSKVPPKPDSDRRHSLGQVSREGDRNAMLTTFEPRLECLPRFVIDSPTISALGQNAQNRGCLRRRIGHGQRKHLGFVLDVQPHGRRRHDQTRRPLAFD